MKKYRCRYFSWYWNLFDDAGSPSQRCLNENWNTIIRKDLPKSTSLSIDFQERINMIVYNWNSILENH